MKVTICYTEHRVVVPCDDGNIRVGEVIQRAVSRLKKLPDGIPCGDCLLIKYLLTKDRAVLDVDDVIKDVADNGEVLFADSGCPPQKSLDPLPGMSSLVLSSTVTPMTTSSTTPQNLTATPSRPVFRVPSVRSSSFEAIESNSIFENNNSTASTDSLSGCEPGFQAIKKAAERLNKEIARTGMIMQPARSFEESIPVMQSNQLSVKPEVAVPTSSVSMMKFEGTELCQDYANGGTINVSGEKYSSPMETVGVDRHGTPLREGMGSSRLDRSIECQLCHRVLKNPDNYRRHMYIHNNERPFCCRFCSKRFRAKSDLTVHERIHTGEKPYTCPFDGCDRRFGDRSSFRRHKLAHSGRRVKKDSPSMIGMSYSSGAVNHMDHYSSSSHGSHLSEPMAAEEENARLSPASPPLSVVTPSLTSKMDCVSKYSHIHARLPVSSSDGCSPATRPTLLRMPRISDPSVMPRGGIEQNTPVQRAVTAAPSRNSGGDFRCASCVHVFPTLATLQAHSCVQPGRGTFG